MGIRDIQISQTVLSGTELDVTNDGTKTTFLPPAGDYLRFGDATTTTHSLNTNDDVLITGKLEVDGLSYFDSNMDVNADIILDTNKITMNNVLIREDISGPDHYFACFESDNTTLCNLACLKTYTAQVWAFDNGQFSTPGADGAYWTFMAMDTGVDIVECGRLAGAADPYFSFGGSQQFKFYNSGVATLGGALTITDDIAMQFGTSGDASIIYETADADAKVLLFTIDESDDSGNNVPAFVFAEETNALNTDLGLLDGVVEACVVVLNNAGDAYVALDAGDVNGTENGLYFKPAADENVTLLKVGVTGTPTISWDETNDRISVSGGLYTGSVFTSNGGISMVSTSSINAGWVQDGYVVVNGYDTGVGYAEIMRWQGAAEPHVQIGRNDTNVGDASVTDNLLILGGRGAQASANNTGVGIAFYLGNDQTTPENEKRGALNYVLVSNSNGAEEAEFHVWTMDGGALNQAFKVGGNGELYADLDGDSGSYLTNGVNLFDEFDDVEELRRFQLTVPETGLISEEQRMANRERLWELGVVSRGETGDHLKVQSMFRLTAGGIYQNRQYISELEDRLTALEARL